MEIQDFYKQAKQWQMEKEEQDRLVAEKLQKDLKEAWKGAVDVVKMDLNISGARLRESEPGMTGHFPQLGFTYAFDLVLPGVEYTPVYDENRSMDGIIRIFFMYKAVLLFEVQNYYVWIKGEPKKFENSFEAFLTCCEEIGYQPEYRENTI